MNSFRVDGWQNIPRTTTSWQKEEEEEHGLADDGPLDESATWNKTRGSTSFARKKQGKCGWWGNALVEEDSCPQTQALRCAGVVAAAACCCRLKG